MRRVGNVVAVMSSWARSQVDVARRVAFGWAVSAYPTSCILSS
jgi:hypothetical protein